MEADSIVKVIMAVAGSLGSSVTSPVSRDVALKPTSLASGWIRKRAGSPRRRRLPEGLPPRPQATSF
jgi:hypothetical protein